MPRRYEVLRIAVSSIPLGELVEMLMPETPASGKISVSRSVPDMRFNVFGNQISGLNVLLDLASLLNCLWVDDQGTTLASLESANRSTLIQPDRIRKYEEMALRECLNDGAAPLFRLATFSRTPPERWRTSKADTGGDGVLTPGNRQLLSLSGSHGLFRLLDSLSVQQKYELIRNQVLTIPWGIMSSTQREIAHAVIPQIRLDEGDRPLKPVDRERIQTQARNSLVRHGYSLHVMRDSLTGLIRRSEWGEDLFTEDMRRGPRAEIRTIKAPRGVPYTVRALPDMGTGLPSEKWERRRFPNLRFTPDLYASPETTWALLLAQLADSMPDLTLISDAYTGTPAQEVGQSRLIRNPYLPDVVSLATGSLAKGLDALCETFGRVWWTQGRTIFFRSRTWFLRQLYETPINVLERIAGVLNQEKADYPALLGIMGRLTREQIQGLSVAAYFSGRKARGERGLRSHYYFDTTAAFDYIQLMSLLLPAQLQLALTPPGPTTPRGLRIEDLSEAQRAIILHILQRTIGYGIYGNLDAIRVRVEIEPYGRRAATADREKTRHAPMGCNFIFNAITPGPAVFYFIEIGTLLHATKG